jgi:rod shape-determining protein MreD
MKVIAYILYLFLIGLYQVIFRDITGIYGASINLAAFIVLAVAIYKSELAAAWFGFAAGVVLAAGNPPLMGWQALSLSLLGVLAYNVKERLNLESLYAKILLIFGGVFLHNVVTLIIDGGDAFLYRLVSESLTGAIYTSALAIVFFIFKEEVVTPAKVKSVF